MSFIHSLVVLIIFLAIFLTPLVMIITKAGYSGWWVLLWFVPIVNIVMLWVFAFADWPGLRQPQTYAAQGRGY
jgi:predicted ABC-type exoprotein transport system permease subunit